MGAISGKCKHLWRQLPSLPVPAGGTTLTRGRPAPICSCQKDMRSVFLLWISTDSQTRVAWPHKPPPPQPPQYFSFSTPRSKSLFVPWSWAQFCTKVSLLYCSSLNKICLADFSKCPVQIFLFDCLGICPMHRLPCRRSYQVLTPILCPCWVPGWRAIFWHVLWVPHLVPTSSFLLRTSQHPTPSLNRCSVCGLSNSWMHVHKHSYLWYYSLNVCIFKFIHFHKL